MEAASRPPVEPLPDLPVEAPDFGTVPTLTPAKGTTATKAAPAGIEGTQTVEFLNAALLDASEEKARPAPAPASAPEPANSTESTLTLLKPEFLTLGDEAPAEASPAAASGQPEAPLALAADPVDPDIEVDQMLSAPPPPAPRPVAATTPPAPAARSVFAEEEPLTLIPESRTASAKPAAATKPASPSAAPAAKASETPPGTPVLVPDPSTVIFTPPAGI